MSTKEKPRASIVDQVVPTSPRYSLHERASRREGSPKAGGSPTALSPRASFVECSVRHGASQKIRMPKNSPLHPKAQECCTISLDPTRRCKATEIVGRITRCDMGPVAASLFEVADYTEYRSRVTEGLSIIESSMSTPARRNRVLWILLALMDEDHSQELGTALAQSLPMWEHILRGLIDSNSATTELRVTIALTGEILRFVDRVSSLEDPFRRAILSVECLLFGFTITSGLPRDLAIESMGALSMRREFLFVDVSNSDLEAMSRHFEEGFGGPYIYDAAVVVSRLLKTESLCITLRRSKVLLKKFCSGLANPLQNMHAHISKSRRAIVTNHILHALHTLNDERSDDADWEEGGLLCDDPNFVLCINKFLEITCETVNTRELTLGSMKFCKELDTKSVYEVRISGMGHAVSLIACLRNNATALQSLVRNYIFTDLIKCLVYCLEHIHLNTGYARALDAPCAILSIMRLFHVVSDDYHLAFVSNSEFNILLLLTDRAPRQVLVDLMRLLDIGLDFDIEDTSYQALIALPLIKCMFSIVARYAPVATAEDEDITPPTERECLVMEIALGIVRGQMRFPRNVQRIAECFIFDGEKSLLRSILDQGPRGVVFPQSLRLCCCELITGFVLMEFYQKSVIARIPQEGNIMMTVQEQSQFRLHLERAKFCIDQIILEEEAWRRNTENWMQAIFAQIRKLRRGLYAATKRKELFEFGALVTRRLLELNLRRVDQKWQTIFECAIRKHAHSKEMKLLEIDQWYLINKMRDDHLHEQKACILRHESITSCIPKQQDEFDLLIEKLETKKEGLQIEQSLDQTDIALKLQAAELEDFGLTAEIDCVNGQLQFIEEAIEIFYEQEKSYSHMWMTWIPVRIHVTDVVATDVLTRKIPREEKEMRLDLYKDFVVATSNRMRLRSLLGQNQKLSRPVSRDTSVRPSMSREREQTMVNRPLSREPPRPFSRELSLPRSPRHRPESPEKGKPLSPHHSQSFRIAPSSASLDPRALYFDEIAKSPEQFGENEVKECEEIGDTVAWIMPLIEGPSDYKREVAARASIEIFENTVRKSLLIIFFSEGLELLEASEKVNRNKLEIEILEMYLRLLENPCFEYVDSFHNKSLEIEAQVASIEARNRSADDTLLIGLQAMNRRVEVCLSTTTATLWQPFYDIRSYTANFLDVETSLLTNILTHKKNSVCLQDISLHHSARHRYINHVITVQLSLLCCISITSKRSVPLAVTVKEFSRDYLEKTRTANHEYNHQIEHHTKEHEIRVDHRNVIRTAMRWFAVEASEPTFANQASVAGLMKRPLQVAHLSRAVLCSHYNRIVDVVLASQGHLLQSMQNPEHTTAEINGMLEQYNTVCCEAIEPLLGPKSITALPMPLWGTGDMFNFELMERMARVCLTSLWFHSKVPMIDAHFSWMSTTWVSIETEQRCEIFTLANTSFMEIVKNFEMTGHEVKHAFERTALQEATNERILEVSRLSQECTCEAFVATAMRQHQTDVEGAYEDVAGSLRHALLIASDGVKKLDIMSQQKDLSTLRTRDLRRIMLFQRQLCVMLDSKRDDVVGTLYNTIDKSFATQLVRLKAKFAVGTTLVARSTTLNALILTEESMSHAARVRYEHTQQLMELHYCVHNAFLDMTHSLALTSGSTRSQEAMSDFSQSANDLAFVLQQRGTDRKKLHETQEMLMSQLLLESTKIRENSTSKVNRMLEALGTTPESRVLYPNLLRHLDTKESEAEEIIRTCTEELTQLPARLTKVFTELKRNLAYHVSLIRKNVAKEDEVINFGKLFVVDSYQTLMDAILEEMSSQESNFTQTMFRLVEESNDGFHSSMSGTAFLSDPQDSEFLGLLLQTEHSESIQRIVMESSCLRQRSFLCSFLLQELLPSLQVYEGSCRQQVDSLEVEARSMLLFEAAYERRKTHDRVPEKVVVDGVILPSYDDLDTCHDQLHEISMELLGATSSTLATTQKYGKSIQEIRSNVVSLLVFMQLHLSEIYADMARYAAVDDGLNFLVVVQGQYFEATLGRAKTRQIQVLHNAVQMQEKMLQLRVKYVSAKWECLGLKLLHQRTREKLGELSRGRSLRVQVREHALAEDECNMKLQASTTSQHFNDGFVYLEVNEDFMQILQGISTTPVLPLLEVRLASTVYDASTLLSRRYTFFTRLFSSLQQWTSSRGLMNTEAKLQIQLSKLRTIASTASATWVSQAKSATSDEVRFMSQVTDAQATFGTAQENADLQIQENQARATIMKCYHTSLYIHRRNLKMCLAAFEMVSWEASRRRLATLEHHTYVFLKATKEISHKMAEIARVREIERQQQNDALRGLEKFHHETRMLFGTLSDRIMLALSTDEDCDPEIYSDIMLILSVVECQVDSELEELDNAVKMFHRTRISLLNNDDQKLEQEYKWLERAQTTLIPLAADSEEKIVRDLRMPGVHQTVRNYRHLWMKEQLDTDYILDTLGLQRVAFRDKHMAQVTSLRCVHEGSYDPTRERSVSPESDNVTDLAITPPKSVKKRVPTPPGSPRTLSPRGPHISPEPQPQQLLELDTTSPAHLVLNAPFVPCMPPRQVLSSVMAGDLSTSELKSEVRLHQTRASSLCEQLYIFLNAPAPSTSKELSSALNTLAFNLDLARYSVDMSSTEPKDTNSLEEYEAALRIRIELEATDNFQKITHPHLAMQKQGLSHDEQRARHFVAREQHEELVQLMFLRSTERDRMEEQLLKAAHLERESWEVARRVAVCPPSLEEPLGSLEAGFGPAYELCKEIAIHAETLWMSSLELFDDWHALQTCFYNYKQRELKAIIHKSAEEELQRWREAERQNDLTIESERKRDQKRAAVLAWKVHASHSMMMEHMQRVQTKRTKGERDAELRRQVRERQALTNELNQKMSAAEESAPLARRLSDSFLDHNERQPVKEGPPKDLGEILQATWEDMRTTISNPHHRDERIHTIVAKTLSRLQSLQRAMRVSYKNAVAVSEILAEWVSRVESTRSKISNVSTSSFFNDSIIEKMRSLTAKQRGVFETLMAQGATEIFEIRRAVITSDRDIVRQRAMLVEWEEFSRAEIHTSWSQNVLAEKQTLLRSCMRLLAAEEQLSRHEIIKQEVFEVQCVQHDKALDQKRSELSLHSNALVHHKLEQHRYISMQGNAMVQRLLQAHNQILHYLANAQRSVLTVEIDDSVPLISPEERAVVKVGFEGEREKVAQGFNQLIRIVHTLWIHAIANADMENREKIAVERQTVKRMEAIQKEAESMIKAYRKKQQEMIHNLNRSTRAEAMAKHIATIRNESDVSKLWGQMNRKVVASTKANDALLEYQRYIKIRLASTQRQNAAAHEASQQWAAKHKDLETTHYTALNTFSKLSVQTLVERAKGVLGGITPSSDLSLVEFISEVLSRVVLVPPEVSWKYVPRRQVLYRHIDIVKKLHAQLLTDICWDSPMVTRHWERFSSQRQETYAAFRTALDGALSALKSEWVKLHVELLIGGKARQAKTMLALTYDQDIDRDIIEMEFADRTEQLRGLQSKFSMHALMNYETYARSLIVELFLDELCAAHTEFRRQTGNLTWQDSMKTIYDESKDVLTKMDDVSHSELYPLDRTAWIHRLTMVQRHKCKEVFGLAAAQEIIADLFPLRLQVTHEDVENDNSLRVIAQATSYAYSEVATARHLDSLLKLKQQEDIENSADAHFSYIMRTFYISHDSNETTEPTDDIATNVQADAGRTRREARSLEREESAIFTKLLQDRLNLTKKLDKECETCYLSHIDNFITTESEWVFRAQIGLDDLTVLNNLRRKALLTLNTTQLQKEEAMKVAMVQRLEAFDSCIISNLSPQYQMPHLLLLEKWLRRTLQLEVFAETEKLFGDHWFSALRELLTRREAAMRTCLINHETIAVAALLIEKRSDNVRAAVLSEENETRRTQQYELDQILREKTHCLATLSKHRQRMEEILRNRHIVHDSLSEVERMMTQAQLSDDLEALRFASLRDRVQADGDWTLILTEFNKDSSEQLSLLASKASLLRTICDICMTFAGKERKIITDFFHTCLEGNLAHAACLATLYSEERLAEGRFDHTKIINECQRHKEFLSRKLELHNTVVMQTRETWLVEQLTLLTSNGTTLPDIWETGPLALFSNHVLSSLLSQMMQATFHEPSQKKLDLRMQHSKKKRNIVVQHLTSTAALENEWIFLIEEAQKRDKTADLSVLQRKMRDAIQEAKQVQVVELQAAEEVYQRAVKQLLSSFLASSSPELLLLDTVHTEDDDRTLITLEAKDGMTELFDAFFARIRTCLIAEHQRIIAATAFEEDNQRTLMKETHQNLKQLVPYDTAISNLHMLHDVYDNTERRTNDSMVEEIVQVCDALHQCIDKKFALAKISRVMDDFSASEKASHEEVKNTLKEVLPICSVAHVHGRNTAADLYRMRVAAKLQRKNIQHRRVQNAIDKARRLAALREQQFREVQQLSCKHEVNIAQIEATNLHGRYLLENEHKYRFGLLQMVQSHREEAIRQVGEKNTFESNYKNRLKDEKYAFDNDMRMLMHSHKAELLHRKNASEKFVDTVHNDVVPQIMNGIEIYIKQADARAKMLYSHGKGLYDKVLLTLKSLEESFEEGLSKPFQDLSTLGLIAPLSSALLATQQQLCEDYTNLTHYSEKHVAVFYKVWPDETGMDGRMSSPSPGVSPRGEGPISPLASPSGKLFVNASPSQGRQEEWLYNLDDLDIEHQRRIFRLHGNVIVEEIQLFLRHVIVLEQEQELHSLTHRLSLWSMSYVEYLETTERISTVCGEEALAFSTLQNAMKVAAADVLEDEELRYQAEQKIAARAAVDAGGSWAGADQLENETARHNAARMYNVKKKMGILKAKAYAERQEARLQIGHATRKDANEAFEVWQLKDVSHEFEDRTARLARVHAEGIRYHLGNPATLEEELGRHRTDRALLTVCYEQQLSQLEVQNKATRTSLQAAFSAEQTVNRGRNRAKNQTGADELDLDEDVTQLNLERMELQESYEQTVRQLKQEYRMSLNSITLKLRAKMESGDESAAGAKRFQNAARQAQMQNFFKRFLDEKFKAHRDHEIRMQQFEMESAEKYPERVRRAELLYREEVARFVLEINYGEFVTFYNQQLIKLRNANVMAEELAARRRIYAEEESKFANIFSRDFIQEYAVIVQRDLEDTIMLVNAQSMAELKDLGEEHRTLAITVFQLEMDRLREARSISNSELWTALTKNKDKTLEPLVFSVGQALGIAHLLTTLFHHECEAHRVAQMHALCVSLKAPKECLPLAQAELQTTGLKLTLLMQQKIDHDEAFGQVSATGEFVENMSNHIDMFWYQDELAGARTVELYETIEKCFEDEKKLSEASLLEQRLRLDSLRVKESERIAEEISTVKRAHFDVSKEICERVHCSHASYSGENLLEFIKIFVSTFHVHVDTEQTTKMGMYRESLEGLIASEKQTQRYIKSIACDDSFMTKLQAKLEDRGKSGTAMLDNLFSCMLLVGTAHKTSWETDNVTLTDWETMLRRILLQNNRAEWNEIIQDMVRELCDALTQQEEILRDSLGRDEVCEREKLIVDVHVKLARIELEAQLAASDVSASEALSNRELQRALEGARLRFEGQRLTVKEHFRSLFTVLENKYQLDKYKLDCQRQERLSKVRSQLEVEFIMSEAKLELEALQLEIKASRDRIETQYQRELKQVDTDLELCLAVLEYQAAYVLRESNKRRGEYEATQQSLRTQSANILRVVPTVAAAERERTRAFNAELRALEVRWVWKTVGLMHTKLAQLRPVSERLRSLLNTTISTADRCQGIIEFTKEFATILGTLDFEIRLERTVVKLACERNAQRMLHESKKSWVGDFERVGVVFDGRIPKVSVSMAALSHFSSSSSDVVHETRAARARALATKLYLFHQTQHLKINQLQLQQTQEMLSIESKAFSEATELNQLQYQAMLTMKNCEDCAVRLRGHFYQRNETQRKFHQLLETTRVVQLQALQGLDTKIQADTWDYEKSLLVKLPPEEMYDILEQSQAVSRQNVEKLEMEGKAKLELKGLSFFIDHLTQTEPTERMRIMKTQDVMYESQLKVFRTEIQYHSAEDEIHRITQQKGDECKRQTDTIADTELRVRELQGELLESLYGTTKDRLSEELSEYWEFELERQRESLRQYEARENSRIVLRTLVLDEGFLLRERIVECVLMVEREELQLADDITDLEQQKAKAEYYMHSNMIYDLEAFDNLTEVLIAQSVATSDKEDEFKRRARDRSELLDIHMNHSSEKTQEYIEKASERNQKHATAMREILAAANLVEQKNRTSDSEAFNDVFEDALLSMRGTLGVKQQTDASTQESQDLEGLLNGLFVSQEATQQRRKELDVEFNEQRVQVMSMMTSFLLLVETINSEQDTAYSALEANGATPQEFDKLHSDFKFKRVSVAVEQADHISVVLQQAKRARMMKLKELSVDTNHMDSDKDSDNLSPRSKFLLVRISESSARDSLFSEQNRVRTSYVKEFYGRLKASIEEDETTERVVIEQAELERWSQVIMIRDDIFEASSGKRPMSLESQAFASLSLKAMTKFEGQAGKTLTSPRRRVAAHRKSQVSVNGVSFPARRRIPILEAYMEECPAFQTADDMKALWIRNILLDEYLHRQSKEKEESDLRESLSIMGQDERNALLAWIERRRAMFWQVVGMQFLPSEEEKKTVRAVLHAKDSEAVEWCEAGGTFEQLVAPAPPELRAKMSKRRWSEVAAAREQAAAKATQDAKETFQRWAHESDLLMNSPEQNLLVRSPLSIMRTPPPDVEVNQVLFRRRQLHEYQRKFHEQMQDLPKNERIAALLKPMACPAEWTATEQGAQQLPVTPPPLGAVLDPAVGTPARNPRQLEPLIKK